MSLDRHEEGRFRSSPTGPRVAPPRQPMAWPAAPPPQRAGRRRRYWSVIIFILLISGAGIRAYKDLSRPEAWAYWKDQYYAPSLTSRLIAKADLDGSGHGRPALAVSGAIGPAAASWFRDRLDEAIWPRATPSCCHLPAAIWIKPSSSMKSFAHMGS